MKHCKEPWVLVGKAVDRQTDFKIKSESETICKFAAYEFWGCDIGTTNANAERIVACVNAMAGIEDPQQLRDTWDLVKDLELDAYHKLKEKYDEALLEIERLKGGSK